MSTDSIPLQEKISEQFLDKAVVCLLLGVVVLNPFPHNTFTLQVFFYAAFIPVIMLAKRNQNRFYFQSPLLYPLLIFLFWSLISAVFALDKVESFRDIYSHLVRYFIYYFILINFFNSKKRIVLISSCVVLSEFVFMAGALIYNYGILDYDFPSRFGAPFSTIAPDIIPFGFIMGIMLTGWLLTFQKKVFFRCLLAAVIIAFLVGTVLTYSRGAFLCWR